MERPSRSIVGIGTIALHAERQGFVPGGGNLPGGGIVEYGRGYANAGRDVTASNEERRPDTVQNKTNKEEELLAQLRKEHQREENQKEKSNTQMLYSRLQLAALESKLAGLPPGSPEMMALLTQKHLYQSSLSLT